MVVISAQHGENALGVREEVLKIRVIVAWQWKAMDGKEGDRPQRDMGVRPWTWLLIKEMQSEVGRERRGVDKQGPMVKRKESGNGWAGEINTIHGLYPHSLVVSSLPLRAIIERRLTIAPRLI